MPIKVHASLIQCKLMATLTVTFQSDVRCNSVFILHKDRHQHRFPFSLYLCRSRFGTLDSF